MDYSLPKLNLPTYTFRTKTDHIFDRLRKKWVTLTPEEWVRQNFITYLVNEKKYPKSLIRIEERIEVFNKIKRCDAVIYTNEIKPLVIIEFKNMHTKIGTNTFEQIALYNSSILANYLMITNGLDHFCIKFNFNDNTHTFLEEIPPYEKLIT